ncbi:hypothetical protein J1N35_017588 [Gossypium stocksii]|uniref:Endonuclease/exonuclease/phosphatase domain-containing protein n=1 Tax=Gossypium stocksii TaxID=47602 RepID=A0A9D3VME1_9ROSI|nr:hypothetical protein J1N35_017588 [Gossypium stocksii]
MDYKPDIVSLLETRVSGAKADNIIAKLGFQYSHRVEAIGYSGGIWIGWKDTVRLEVICSHPQNILTRIWQFPSVHPIFITFVYGSPNRKIRQVLWKDLRKSKLVGQIPWMVISDFNAILSSSEKFGGVSKGKRCPFFGDFVDSSKLHDLSFSGPPFTWHRGTLFERLDRALGNEAWIRNFLNCMVYHLPKVKSDHRPLLLVLNSSFNPPWERPFRFLAGWVEHPNFDKFLKKNWEYSGSISNSLDKLTFHFKKWNRTVYGNINTRKRDLIKRIASLQERIDYDTSNSFNHEDSCLLQELENVLNHEELLWKQKAMCD